MRFGSFRTTANRMSRAAARTQPAETSQKRQQHDRLKTLPGLRPILLKVIAEDSGDPAVLRRLVDAMASRNPRLDTVLAEPVAQVTRQARRSSNSSRCCTSNAPSSASKRSRSAGWLPQPAGQGRHLRSRAAGNAPADPRSADTAGPIGMQAEAPIQGSNAMRLSIRSFLQVSAATVIGALSFLAFPCGSIGSGRRRRTTPAPARPGCLPAKSLPAPRKPWAPRSRGRIEPPPPPHNSLPFPLPVSYGVYAGSNGQLTELEPLPVEVPARARGVSAEITKPSRVTLPARHARVRGVQKKSSPTTSPPRYRRAWSGGSHAPPPSSISGRR